MLIQVGKALACANLEQDFNGGTPSEAVCEILDKAGALEDQAMRLLGITERG